MPIFEDLLNKISILDTALFHAINSKLSELVIKNEIKISVHRAILRVMSESGQVLAENAILKRRLAEAEKLICARQEHKNGKRNF